MGFDISPQTTGLSKHTRELKCLLAMNRLIAPASEDALPARIRPAVLGDLLGTNFDSRSVSALNRNMGRLHPRRSLFRSDFVERE